MAVTADDIFKEGITEVIVTTVSKAGVPNAAPMGIVRQEGRYFIRMYSETTTFSNVSQTGYLAANLTADPMVYVVSAFRELTPEYFQFEEGMVAPSLKDAAGRAYFKCRVKDVVELEPVSVKVAVVYAACLQQRVRRSDRGHHRGHEATFLQGGRGQEKGTRI